MNLFAEMFRSKVSSADPLSPGHDQRSPPESLILLYRKIVTQSLWGEGKGEGKGVTNCGCKNPFSF
jgi:hypothetical protein